MKEIIQVCNKYSSYGGVEVVVKEIHKHLGGRVYASEKQVIGDDIDIIRPERVFELRGQFIPLSYKYYKNLLGDIKNHTPLIHLPTLIGLLVLFLCVLNGRRCIVLQHARGDGLIGQLYFQISKFFYKFKNVKVIVSSNHELKFSRLTGRADVINFFCSFKSISVRSRINLANHNKTIVDLLFIGRLVDYKGIIPLIDNITSINSSYALRLHIIGNGPLMTEVLQKQREYPNILKVYGSVSQFKKYRILTRVDALVVSSINRGEAFNLTQLEALSTGCPIILRKLSSGTQDTAKHSKIVYRYSSRIESAIDSLLSINEVDIEESLEFYKQKYSKDQTFRKLIEVIDND